MNQIWRVNFSIKDSFGSLLLPCIPGFVVKHFDDLIVAMELSRPVRHCFANRVYRTRIRTRRQQHFESFRHMLAQ